MVKSVHGKSKNKTILKPRKLTTLEIQRTLLRRNSSLITIREFSRVFKLSSRRLIYRRISEAVRDEVLVRLKLGLYFLYISPPKTFEIANVLYKPSYVSLDTALSYYRIIPESVYSVTSLTTKHTRSFFKLNKNFTYSKINKNLYFGYKKVAIGDTQVLMADKEKAFLDYIYFVVMGLRKTSDRFDLAKLDKDKIDHYMSLFNKGLSRRKFKAFYNIVNELL